MKIMCDTNVIIDVLSIHCDYIVTRNKRDFEGFGIPVLTPAEILLKII